MASTRLTFTQGTPTDGTAWTYSGWIKIADGTDTNTYALITSYQGTNNDRIQIDTSRRIHVEFKDGASTVYEQHPTVKLRDTNGWYHVVVAFDSSEAQADRVKIYLNGTRLTDMDIDQELTTSGYTTKGFNASTKVMDVGAYNAAGSYLNFFDGSMAHVHFTDGTAYAASAFGETDATTGQWKPKPSPSVTYGNNGWFLKFSNSGSMGTDSSGNGNNFTVAAGTLTQTQDTPSNVFCRLNTQILTPDSSWANTNLRFNGPSSHKSTWGTFGFSSGKWYWEAKATSSGTDKHTVGLDDMRNQSNHKMVSGTNLIIGYTPSAGYANGDGISWYYDTLRKNGSVIASSLSAIVNNDIMMVAVDADNGKIYFGKNGTWRVANSSTFDSAQHDTTFTIGETYCPAFAAESCSWLCNFGDGYFGTTAVSSANSDDAGYGLFEYAPPTGYYSLCTKNINTYG